MRHIIFLFALLLAMPRVLHAQHAEPPSTMANDLCSCLGTISPKPDDRQFDRDVRLCLNTVVASHSREVVELLRQYPAEDRKMYLLGLLLGHALDRTCPQYPLVKERLRHLLQPAPKAIPST